MKKTVLSMLMVAVGIVATFGINSTAHAVSYSGARVWDDGPYTVWSGVDADDSSLQIMAVIGQTSSVSVTYPTGSSAPAIQYLTGRAELSVGIGKKLMPIDPPWVGFIMTCRMSGSSIWCYCDVKDGATCSQGSIVDGQASQTWLNIQYAP